jgi:hypothetical protein
MAKALVKFAALTLACCPAVWGDAVAPLPPPADRQLARDLLKELVEIDTTHKFGSTAAAKAIQSRLQGAGFKTNELLLIAPPDHPTKGSLIVRYHGPS